MPVPAQRKAEAVVLRFGGGVNSEASETEVLDAECIDGGNFDLRLGSSDFAPRKAFDLVDTAPNAKEIRGFAQVIKADGSTSTLVQAGAQIYEWDGIGGFTVVAAVNSAARLRGGQFQLWSPGTPKVFITDLNLNENVKTWDGTTFADATHDLGGNLKARYCLVQNERVFFANVYAGSTLPHYVIASGRSASTSFSIATRGGAAGAGAADPFYFPVPDLNYINGISDAFGEIILSTRRGRIYRMTGDSTLNYAISNLVPDSGASGDEPIAFIGNDVAYGRPGKIETVFATSNFGDIDTDDLSRQIKGKISNLKDWNVYFNSRLQKIYLFSPNHSKVYVYHKTLLDPDVRRIDTAVPAPKLSPWSIWSTQHAMGFQPTAVMTFRDPQTGVEKTYMGGGQGQIWVLDGSGAQDGGTSDLIVTRTSKLFTVGDAEIFDLSGYVSYRKRSAQTLTLTFQHAGDRIFDQDITVNLDAPDSFPVWGGGSYWGGFYWGLQFQNRLTRQRISPAGASNYLQIKASITGAADFSVQEIGITFQAAKPGAT